MKYTEFRCYNLRGELQYFVIPMPIFLFCFQVVIIKFILYLTKLFIYPVIVCPYLPLPFIRCSEFLEMKLKQVQIFVGLSPDAKA